MSFSDTTPTLEWLAEDRWRLAVAFTYTCQGGEVIEVPAGMLTDLASIPRIFRNLLQPDGPYLPAALVHDCLYSSHRAGSDRFTRDQADAILLAGMEELGVGWVTRKAVYWAVRLGGRGAWALAS